MIRSYIQEVVQYIKRVCHVHESLSLLQTMFDEYCMSLWREMPHCMVTLYLQPPAEQLPRAASL